MAANKASKTSKASRSKPKQVDSLPDTRRLKRIYAAFPNIASITIAEGTLRVDFHAIAPLAPLPVAMPFTVAATPEQPVTYVAGTPFADDKSPLNPIDLILYPPTIDASATEN